MAVHNAGGRRQQRGVALQRRLQRLCFGAREQAQVVHAIGGSALLDGAQFIHLIGTGRHDELAAALVGDAALGAVVVQHLLALHAQTRFQRAGRVVDAGVDDLAVARAGAGAKGVGGFQHHHFAPLQRQRARHRQAHHAGADDHGVDLLRAHDSKPSMTAAALWPSSAAA